MRLLKIRFLTLLILFVPFLLAASEFGANRQFAREQILSAFQISDIEQTDALWVQEGKNRWEFDHRYESMRIDLWPLFKKAELTDAAFPISKTYDYLFVHGSLLDNMKKRWSFACLLWERGVRFSQIIFLTGKRNLLPSEKASITDPAIQTEKNLFEWIYKNHPLPPEMAKIQTEFVNALAISRPNRPNTNDTIAAWLASSPKPGSCLAISNQPYLQYQHAVLSRKLPPSFTLETVGPAIDESESVALILDTLGRTLKQESLLLK